MLPLSKVICGIEFGIRRLGRRHIMDILQEVSSSFSKPTTLIKCQLNGINLAYTNEHLIAGT